MHGKTPPDINYADFSDGQSALAQAEPTHGTESTAPAKTSCSSPPECEVLSLCLESSHADDTVKTSESLIEPHNDPKSGAARFRVIPANGVTIKWTIKNAAQVDHAVLELFAKGNPNAIWSHDLTQGISDAGQLAWDTKVTHGQAAYPDDLVNMEESPYKMKLTIRPKEGAVCTKPRGYTYFDVDFEHRYRIATYVPTTNLGRFGLEFDPKEAEVKISAKTFFVMHVPETGAFRQNLAHYKTEFINRCTTMWNQRYKVKDAANKTWNVSLYVQDVGSASVTQASDARTIDACPPDVISAFEASGAEFCVVLLPGNGGSGLPTPDYSRAANIFLYEVAFDDNHPPQSAASVVEGHRKLVFDDWTRIWAAHTPHTAVKADTRANGVHPTFTIKFAPESDDLGDTTKALLQDISNSLKKQCEGMRFRAFVKGCRTAGETPRLEELRATRINELLAPDPHPCRRTADELLAEAPETKLDAVAGAEIEGAVIEIRHIGGDIPYTAAVHEFGHLIGLPDEYAEYNQGFCPKAAPSQGEYRALSRAANLEHCPIPYLRNNHLMSAGTQFFERYYLTFLQALKKVTGFVDEADDAQWVIQGPLAAGAAPAGAFSPDFAPLIKAVKTAETQAFSGEGDLVVLETSMRTTAMSEGAERVVYSRISDRATLHQIAPGRAQWDVGDNLLFGVGVQKGRQLLHCITCVQPRLVKPLIEIPGATSEANNATTVSLRRLDAARREKIVLRSSQPFQGDGIFTCANPNIEFYDSDTSATPMANINTGITINSATLWAGRTLYADNELDGAVLNLQLNPSPNKRVSTDAAITNLRYPAQAGPWFQVYNFSVDPSEVCEAARQVEKNQGIYVPLTGGENPQHLKLRVMVKVCLPMGFTDTIILRVWDAHLAMLKRRSDPTADRKGNKIIRRVDDRNEVWREYELRPTDQKNEHFPDKRTMCVWLEGTAPTTAATGSARLELVSEAFNSRGANKGKPVTTYDSCDVLVGECHHLKVEIPPTPPRTARNVPPTGTPNAAATQVFCAGEVATTLNMDSPYARRDFTRNPPVVIVKGSLPPDRKLKLKAKFAVGLKTQFYRQQAVDDHASLKAAATHKEVTPLPKSNQTVMPQFPNSMDPTEVDVEVPTDDVGSFHILMKVGGSTCYIINLVVVEALALAGPEAPTVANLPAKRAAIATRGFVNGLALVARTGDIPFPAASTPLATLRTQACAVLAGRVHIKGGGPDFQRGVVGRVFAGWIQNKTGGRISGRYRDGSVVPTGVVRMTGDFVDNQGAGISVPIDTGEGMPAADRYFGDAQPALQPIAISPASPLLDTGNDPVGGAKTCLGQRHFAWDPNVICDAVVVAVDSPGTEFLVTHFTNKNALLSRAEYAQSFKSYLCVWTDATGRGLGGNEGGPGDLLYAALAEVGWGFDAAWDITWPDDIKDLGRDARNTTVNWQARATVVEDDTKPLNVTITSAYARYPAAVPAQGLVETRPPAPIRTFAWNAKTV